MFIYNFKEMKLPDIDKLQTNIDTELFMIDNQLNNAIENEETIYSCFVNLSAKNFFNLDNSSILANFNTSFSLISEMQENLEFLKNKLEPIKKLIDQTDFDNDFEENKFLVDIQNLLEEYYKYRTSIQEIVIEQEERVNSIKKSLNNFANKKANIQIAFKDTLSKNQSDSSSNNKKKNVNFENSKEEIKKEKIKKEEIKVNKKEKIKSDLFEKEKPNNNYFEDVSHIDNNNLKDNHLLLISEKENKVYLPYFATDLQQNLLKSDYETYEELIENDYVFPLQKYSSPTISRFKEGFKLMHDKEHESFRNSLKFGLKLIRNYKLHPAVISACRNVGELNDFLDCLDQNTLNTFDIFDIKFDILPTTK